MNNNEIAKKIYKQWINIEPENAPDSLKKFCTVDGIQEQIENSNSNKVFLCEQRCDGDFSLFTVEWKSSLMKSMRY